MNDRPSDWDAQLRAAGYRSTAQRRLVLQALWRLSHATPEELLEVVRTEAPEVNLSTIYRALEVLGEVGLVTHAHFHHGAVTYHAVGGEPHIHLVCRGCGEVTALPSQLAQPLAEAVAEVRGFRTDLSHLTLHGRCANCSAPEAAGSTGPATALGGV